MTHRTTTPVTPATPTTAISEATTDAAATPVMEMLDEHVPLTLLMDLTAPQGPDSRTILDTEGGPDDHWWE